MTPVRPAWTLSLFVALMFVLYGCGSPEANGQNGANAQEDTNDETIEGAADISVTGVEISADSILVGEVVVVDVTLANEGDLAGEKDLALEIDGNEVASQSISVNPPRPALDESTYTVTVQLGWKAEEAGDYELTVNGEYSHTVTVREATTEAEISSPTIETGADGPVAVGDPVVVLADVQNVGNAPGDVEVALEVDGEPISVETVSLKASPDAPETTALTVDFLWVPEQEGVFELSVNGVDAGAVSVAGPPEVNVLAPETGAIQYAGFEDDGGDDVAWYAEVELQGEAIDVIDGELGDEALQWRTTVDVNGDGEFETFSLGTGSTITAELYVEIDECGAIATHHVELEATNSADMSQAAVIQLPVQMVKC